MWKVENVPNLLGDLAEDISGRGVVASVTWWLPLAIIKCERTGTRKGRTFSTKIHRDLLVWKAPSFPDAKQC